MISKKKYRIVTLGCRTNQYESGGYASQLKELGYAPALDTEEADICIVNTCTVTHAADQASKAKIQRLAKENPKGRLIVTGCMVENSKDLSSLSPKLEIVKNQEKEGLIQKVFPKEELFPEFRMDVFEGHTRAFVKIQDGCNSFCTYCIIPYVRGRSRSRPVVDILKEIEGLIASGYQEIVLTGINIGDFDGGGGYRLADLIREVDSLSGLKRLRISSIDPDEVDDKLIQAVLHGKTTCPSMHIVLQSGSNAILKKMNRKYTRQIFLETIKWLKREREDFTVTTDIIVGFPSETEEDFAETLDAMQQTKFAKVHMFPYSERARTRAALYPNKVLPEVIKMRKRKVLEEAERLAFSLREGYVGRKMPVLLEGEDRPGYISGYTSNFLRVLMPSKNLFPNQIVEVLLEENRAEGLYGKCI